MRVYGFDGDAQEGGDDGAVDLPDERDRDFCVCVWGGPDVGGAGVEVGGEGEGAGAGDCCGDGEIQSCNGRGNAWT